MVGKKTYALPESSVMNGGEGPNSYAQNSAYQVFLIIQAYIFTYLLGVPYCGLTVFVEETTTYMNSVGIDIGILDNNHSEILVTMDQVTLEGVTFLW